MSRLFKLGLALFLMSLCFFLAALQIPHIGEGAPDWHTVKRPQIPVQSVSNEPSPAPPDESPDNDCPVFDQAHPPIAVLIAMQECVYEPVYGWKYKYDEKKWVKAYLGTHAVSKYVKKTFTAYWIDTLHCYAFYDDYGRLRLLPDFR